MRFLLKKSPNVNWHLWFAWYPVRIYYGGEYHVIWLEKICRKLHYGYEFAIKEYSLNFDMINKIN